MLATIRCAVAARGSLFILQSQKRVAERHDQHWPFVHVATPADMNASAGFLPVQLMADAAGTSSTSSKANSGLNGQIEIEMRSGVRVCVGPGVDLKVLRGVLTIPNDR